MIVTIIHPRDFHSKEPCKTIEEERQRVQTICSLCGSNKTNIDSRTGRERWARSPNGGYLCLHCYNAPYHAEYSPRRFRFQGKYLLADRNPRTGICALCNRKVVDGDIRRTNLHHFSYDPSDPLAHTIEVCVRCHRRIHAGIIQVIPQ